MNWCTISSKCLHAQEYSAVLNWVVIDELITGAMRINYGQTTNMNLLVSCRYHGGLGSLWCVHDVVGGNWQIAKKVLEASGAILYMKMMLSRLLASTEYQITIDVATPCQLAIKYLEFPTPIYNYIHYCIHHPYQRTVYSQICARERANQQRVFRSGQSDPTFLLIIMTTEMTGAPFEFRDVLVAVNPPSKATQDETKKYTLRGRTKNPFVASQGSL